MAELELLAHADSPEELDAAIGEGADAVCIALKDFSGRMKNSDFSYSQFEKALRSIHRMGRKLYVEVDAVFEQREAARVFKFLKYLSGAGPDAIIVQDFGIIAMVRGNFPSLKLHASAGMNVTSARGANLLSRHGFSRIHLARELSLGEIRDIRTNTNMELDLFVHGSPCMSVSGLCLFSSYLGGKSANRGICTHACGRFYTAHKGKSIEDSDEEEGGYFFIPDDIELIEEIPVFALAGINSFRMKSRVKNVAYIRTVVYCYRLVMDSLDAGEEKQKQAIVMAKRMLKNNSTRSGKGRDAYA